ncbi:hypothetical protein ONQ62_27900, partial [Salmonella enterica subsp. enterica serovar Virginia]|nr:hypothetical protein [Salmonella enterica subsp. enterica serovar Virginia]
TGNLVSGQLTNDATPTLNGRGEAGATINVYLDGNSASIGTTTAPTPLNLRRSPGQNDNFLALKWSYT